MHKKQDKLAGAGLVRKATSALHNEGLRSLEKTGDSVQ
jgi:hypothetical protein